MKRESFIPENARRVTYKDKIDAVAYINPYCLDSSKLELTCFSGKRVKPDLYHVFKDLESLNKALVRYFEAIKTHEDAKKKRRDERKALKHTLEVGHILVSTWGYDQTNVDFYQITKVVSDKTVELREIESMTLDDLGYDRKYVYPKRNAFKGETLTRRCYNDRVSIDSCSSACLWEYDKVLETSYA